MSSETTNRKRRTPNMRRPIVHIERPKCPVCGSVDIETRRSQRNEDGTVSRDALCRTCETTFLIILD